VENAAFILSQFYFKVWFNQYSEYRMFSRVALQPIQFYNEKPENCPCLKKKILNNQLKEERYPDIVVQNYNPKQAQGKGTRISV
jgi:hypothetical protein